MSFFIIAIIVSFVVTYSCVYTNTTARNSIPTKYHFSGDCKKSYSDLRNFIVDYISDNYSEFVTVSLKDRLCSTISMNRKDIEDTLEDFSYITNSKFSADEFFLLFGSDPSVYNLISYVKSRIHLSNDSLMS